MPSDKIIKLVSLNIEGNKHISLITPFFKESGADVICVQEILEHEFHLLQKELGMQGLFAPMTYIGEKDKNLSGVPAVEGIAILTRLPFTRLEAKYYTGSHHPVPHFVGSDMSTVSRGLLIITVEKNHVPITIATTHFTWTPNGQADDRQRRDLRAMLAILDELGDFALVGDFNAPRGREIFTELSEHYRDNIPAEYTTSLNENLSRYGSAVKVMVDGLFTTPKYKAQNVSLACEVSDHCAIVGDIAVN